MSLFVAGGLFGEVGMMLESYFSWQAQFFVKFGIIAGARNVVFSIQNASPT